jgi:hypothetical protein
MELSQQVRFQRAPEKARTQVRVIIRGQHHLGSTATEVDLVRTTEREEATLDPQTLFNNLESQDMRWFNGGDALYQISFLVCAAHRCSDAGLVTFGSDWVGQQCAKKERRVPGNFFIEHDPIPNCFRTGVEVSPRRDRFDQSFARKQPRGESIPPRRMLPQPRYCRRRFRHWHFGIPATDHSTRPHRKDRADWLSEFWLMGPIALNPMYPECSCSLPIS